MFGLRKTIGSVLLAVIFLALAAFATFFYNADQEQKEEITESEIYQDGQATARALLGASLTGSETMVDANLQKNIGLGKTMADFIARVDWRGLLMGTSSESIDNSSLEPSEASSEDVDTAPEDMETGFWSKLGTKIGKEWKSNQEETPRYSPDSYSQDLFFYQKTEEGAEIIITPKNGKELKVTLPFKFLNKL